MDNKLYRAGSGYQESRRIRKRRRITTLAIVVFVGLAGCGGKTKDLDALLLAAVEAGTAGDVTSLVERGANVNAVDEFDRTPLMMAAFGGHSDIARSLIAAGAKLDVTAKYGQTALQFAREGGHQEIVNLLINAGAGG